jgi:hypothetical protein
MCEENVIFTVCDVIAEDWESYSNCCAGSYQDGCLLRILSVA